MKQAALVIGFLSAMGLCGCVRPGGRSAEDFRGCDNAATPGRDAMIPAGTGGLVTAQQLIEAYRDVSGAEVELGKSVREVQAVIRVPSTPAMTKAEVRAFIEQILKEQAGIVAHRNGNHVTFTLQK